MYIKYNPISENVSIQFSLFEVAAKGENDFFIELINKLKEVVHQYDDNENKEIVHQFDKYEGSD